MATINGDRSGQIRFARVVLDVPLAQPLDYLLDENAPAAAVGSCCVVPIGRSEKVGVIVDVSDWTSIAAERLRPVRRLLPEVAPLSARWIELTRFASDYYQHSWGEVAVPALPPFLRELPGARFVSTLQRLRRRHEGENAAGPTGADPPAMHAAVVLNEQQCAAVARINSAREFATHLLFGVTGSGKTDVYLEAIAHRLRLDARAQALLLAPEINLIPQLAARLAARLPGAAIAILHSGLTSTERNAAWLAAHEGRARVVLGTRLAVFASMPRLDLIVVDEEHDSSYKAGDGVRYSARDLAVKRAQIENVPAVLGSATPALETWVHAVGGKYTRLDLEQRANAEAAARPMVETIDSKRFPPQQGLSLPVREALSATVERGEQALVFINRRGYAPVLACEPCGWLSSCPRCSAFAAFHKPDATLRCHHCGWQAAVPRACPSCGNQDLNAVGHGTQRVEEALQALLPAARIARIDRDSTRRKGTAGAFFDAVHAGRVDVLVGTQMVAKGHDFRRVTLVAVLNCDTQLVSHDFRASEHLFSTLVQVAGRAGRAGLASRVLVQTRYPSHPLFAALAALDYPSFAEHLLTERRRARMPPFVRQALLFAEARTLPAAVDFLARARDLPAWPPAVHCYDPVPMPLAQRAGVFRAQLLVEAQTHQALQLHLRSWLVSVKTLADAARPRIRWAIEVDPLAI